MSLVAEFAIPSETVPGGEAFDRFPGASIELERLVPTGDAALPFFWVFAEDLDGFLEVLEREPEIATVDRLAETGAGVLISAKWTPGSAVIGGIETLDATILTAVGTADEWLFRVRAETRARLDEFTRIFTAEDIPVDLRRVFDFAELVGSDRSLTPTQRETLIEAYRRGYFDQPRGTTQSELGEHFGITGRAVSNRLRRGVRNLVRSALLEPNTGSGPRGTNKTRSK